MFQVKKIATIMEVTKNLGVKVFVNARTDSLRYFDIFFSNPIPA